MQALDLQRVRGFFFQTRSVILQTHKNEQRIVLNQGCERCRGGCLFLKILEAQTADFSRLVSCAIIPMSAMMFYFMGLRSNGLGGGGGTLSAPHFGIPACSAVVFLRSIAVMIDPRPSVTRSSVHDSSFVYHPTLWGIV